MREILQAAIKRTFLFMSNNREGWGGLGYPPQGVFDGEKLTN